MRGLFTFATPRHESDEGALRLYSRTAAPDRLTGEPK
jgi:hypothetical protein